MTSLLKNKVFISTRPSGKADDLKKLICQQGAQWYELPMITLEEIPTDEFTQSIFSNLNEYTHVAFTSANAFQFFYDKASKYPHFKDQLSKVKITSIGYKTSELIKSRGLTINFDANVKSGEEFAGQLALFLKGENAKVLWPTSNLAPNTLQKQLNDIATVTRINLYANQAPKNYDTHIIKLIKQAKYDIIICASPSAFHHLYAILKSKSLKIACIGNTTSKAVIKQGIQPLAIAKTPNAKGLYEAIIHYYQKKKSS
jgi:uroporphyrinogen-III synthase